jgi:hypothetical protein
LLESLILLLISVEVGDNREGKAYFSKVELMGTVVEEVEVI